MLSRRSFLQVGYLGLGGVTLADLLALRQLRASTASPAAESAIFILLAGGPSHIDTWDPKPDAPAGIRGEFQSIATSIPGIRFTDQLPRLARDINRFSLVRSVSHTTIVHEPGQRYVLTGVKNARPDAPTLGAVIARFQPSPGAMPNFAAVPSLPGPSAGELGQSCEPYHVFGDGGRLAALGPATNDALVEFRRRFELLQAIDQAQRASTWTSNSLSIRRESYRQAFELLQLDKLRSVANLESEPAEVRDRYGRTHVGDYLLIARRLIESGTRFVTVVLGGWDTHFDAYPVLREQLPPLDQGLSALLGDLDDRGLLASTLVAALGEFGRTPLISSRGGRDHWPAAFTALLAGGGIVGGRIVGATDAQGAQPIDQPFGPEDIAFTVLSQLGIDPSRTQVPPTGRILLTTGRRIGELLSAGL
jgi:hypothetical protein